MPITEQLSFEFSMYSDLAESLGESEMQKDLPVPSNTIWDQLWCVVGGRESYVKAVEAGRWVGFSCSLGADTRGLREPLVEALANSAESATIAAVGDDGEGKLHLLLHEVQHQGQLIRYLLGLDLEVPASWSKRWSL